MVIIFKIDWLCFAVVFSVHVICLRNLADINGDGKMDQLEFSIAIHLVRKKLQGVALPKVLPASIKVDPGKPGSVTTSPVQQVPKQQQASAAPVSQTAKAMATPPPQTAKHTPPAAVRSPPLSELLLIYVIITIYRISNSV